MESQAQAHPVAALSLLSRGPQRPCPKPWGKGLGWPSLRGSSACTCAGPAQQCPGLSGSSDPVLREASFSLGGEPPEGLEGETEDRYLPIPVLLVSSLLGLETFLSCVGKGQCSCPSSQPDGGKGTAEDGSCRARLGEVPISPCSSCFPPFCQITSGPWRLIREPSLPLLGSSSLPTSVLPLAAATQPHPTWSRADVHSPAPSPACWRCLDPSLGGGGLLPRLDRSLHSLTCVIWELFIYSLIFNF